jgi:hypothetical protein
VGRLSATDVLAIWGAVTGTAGSVVAIATLRRDRAKVRVACQIEDRSYKYQQPPSLVIRVTNAGKQPTVVAEIDLATKWNTTGWLFRRTTPLSGIILPWSREDDELARNVPPMENWDIRPRTKKLGPGEVVMVIKALDPDDPLGDVRPYVEDSLGRVSWGPVISAVAQREAVEENERRGRLYG